MQFVRHGWKPCPFKALTQGLKPGPFLAVSARVNSCPDRKTATRSLIRQAVKPRAFENLPGLKALFEPVLFTGLKAGAFSVVPLRGTLMRIDFSASCELCAFHADI